MRPAQKKWNCGNMTCKIFGMAQTKQPVILSAFIHNASQTFAFHILR